MKHPEAAGRPEARPASCAYCDLPVPFAVPGEGPVYCCVGCRWAAAVTGSQGEVGAVRWTASAIGLSVFCTINVVMLTMALWNCAAVPQTPFESAWGDFLRYGALLFSAPVWLLLGQPLARTVVEQLRQGRWTTDLLLLTGVLAAFAVSVVATWRGAGHVYYEVGCVILVLVTLGRWLEATGRLQASAALEELERLLPETVRVVQVDGPERQQPRSELTLGSRVRVVAGERIPVDGRVVRGAGAVDEQLFSGEAVPVEKTAGDAVWAGSLNLDGDLVVEATALPAAGALGRLVEAVRSARLSKGRYQQLADRWSQRFFPLMVGIAGATLLGHGWRGAWETAWLSALSVVLIACPCALALATPLAIWAALAGAARRGVLFRSGSALENLATVRAVCWDKTGTLTTGTPKVRGLLCLREAERPLVEQLAATLAAASNHVFAQAVREELAGSPVAPDVVQVQTVAGRGLKAWSTARGVVALGSARWMAECGLELPRALQEQVAEAEQQLVPGVWCGSKPKVAGAASIVYLGWEGTVRGAFVLEERLRAESESAIAACRRLGLYQTVLTGDRAERAAVLQALLNLPVAAHLLPEEKQSAVRAVGAAHGCVAMVGDGLNDAPALAAADVGLALGCGADVSREAAEVCLLPNDLRLVPWAIEHARRTVATIRQNLLWSFGYNSVGVAAAAGGMLHPALAAVLMVLSSLMVLGNSLRLRQHASQAAGGEEPSTPLRADRHPVPACQEPAR